MADLGSFGRGTNRHSGIANKKERDAAAKRTSGRENAAPTNLNTQTSSDKKRSQQRANASSSPITSTSPTAANAAAKDSGSPLPGSPDPNAGDPGFFSQAKDVIFGTEEERAEKQRALDAGEIPHGGVAFPGVALPGAGVATATGESIVAGLARLARGGLMAAPKIGKLETGVNAGARISAAASNTKTAKQAQGILGKVFSPKVMAAAGAWAGAVFLGKWGQAEGPEPIGFALNKYLIPEAIETGNWTAVDEAKSMQDELLDLSFWENVALWSPVSPLVGIPNKIKGTKLGADVMTKFIEDQKIKSATGESDEDYYARINQDRVDQKAADREADNVYYANLARQRAEAKAADRKADEAYYAGLINNRDKQTASNDKYDADYWAEYQKTLQKSRDDNTPSNLNFGGIV